MTHQAATCIIELYDRNAAAWDRQRNRGTMERGWLDRFLTLVPERGNVLDIGCGAGEPIASYLIGQGRTLTGIDSSPAMIALCQQRFPDSVWTVADMRRLDLGQRFGGVLGWDSFFHLTEGDQRRMFPIFRRHAAPRAALLFTSGPAAGEAIGSWQDEPLYHASLDPAEYRALLAGNGFDVVAHAANDPACGGRTIWLALSR